MDNHESKKRRGRLALGVDKATGYLLVSIQNGHQEDHVIKPGDCDAVAAVFAKVTQLELVADVSVSQGFRKHPDYKFFKGMLSLATVGATSPGMVMLDTALDN